MAKVTYKSYNQNDSLLFPHCIGDFIPENDPVRVLDAIVEHLDISAICKLNGITPDTVLKIGRRLRVR